MVSANHGVGAGHERLLHEADARVIKHSHAEMLIGRDNVDRIHCSDLRHAKESSRRAWMRAG
jgi:hypothetical protein